MCVQVEDGEPQEPWLDGVYSIRELAEAAKTGVESAFPDLDEDIELEVEILTMTMDTKHPYLSLDD